MTSHDIHVPVLLDQVLQSFAQIKPGCLVDCTAGYGGHSNALHEAYGDRIESVGIDRDAQAIEYCRGHYDFLTLYHGDFAGVIDRVSCASITGVLADFGVSSLQLDNRERGFSFHGQSLDMRMDQSAPLTAAKVLNTYSRQALESILRDYGEIRPYRKLAAAIMQQRPFHSATELAALAKKIMPKTKHNPATLLFQALRIEVNDELGQITTLLDKLEKMKPKGCIVAMISFHSLEDRLIKQRFKSWSRGCVCPPEAMRCTCGGDNALGAVQTKKPLTATARECRANPRSSSAKLRVFRFGDD